MNFFKKRTIIILLVIMLLVAGVYIFLVNTGYTNNAILNSPSTMSLSVSCSEVTNLLVASEVNVTVQNNSSRTHNDVTVHLTAYDGDNNIIKEKSTTFARSLSANGSLSKPVGLPARTKRCNCVIESSNPE